MQPSVGIYYAPELPHQREWAGLFMAGLIKHGIEKEVSQYGDPMDHDLLVFWGHGWRNEKLRNEQIAKGRHYLVMERGFFQDRFLHTSLGFDGLNGRACFLNHSSHPSRWSPHSHLLKPWNPRGNYYLLIGQVPGDNSCNHVDINKWCAQVRADADMPVMFRPHPLVEESKTSLAKDMAGAAAVITFSSTVGVDAMLAGKPVIAYDPMSMVYGIAGHDVSEVSRVEPDREQWAYDLAYTQWSRDEIESGEAWDHLRGMYAS